MSPVAQELLPPHRFQMPNGIKKRVKELSNAELIDCIGEIATLVESIKDDMRLEFYAEKVIGSNGEMDELKRKYLQAKLCYDGLLHERRKREGQVK